MLVDVLGALYTGRAAFEDTSRVIGDLARTLHYGRNTWSRTLAASVVRGTGQLLPTAFGRAAYNAAQRLTNRRIERVVFVATKAGHVPAMKRDNLLSLLRDLSRISVPQGSPPSAAVTHRVAAAILSTTDGIGKIGGHTVEIVNGVVLGEEQARPFFIGDVSCAMPPESYWAADFTKIPVFRPPPLDLVWQTGIPHLNLDQVLDDVIGDLL